MQAIQDASTVVTFPWVGTTNSMTDISPIAGHTYLLCPGDDSANYDVELGWLSIVDYVVSESKPAPSGCTITELRLQSLN